MMGSLTWSFEIFVGSLSQALLPSAPRNASPRLNCLESAKPPAKMATNRAQPTNRAHNAPEKSYFDQQREMLVTEIAQVRPSSINHPNSTTPLYLPSVPSFLVLTMSQSLEVVLQNINTLNRSLEEVTQVGNEFAPVEALWSQFENVMAKEASETQDGAQEHEEGEMEREEHQK
jgi:DASH complex subunit DAD1